MPCDVNFYITTTTTVAKNKKMAKLHIVKSKELNDRDILNMMFVLAAGVLMTK